MSKSIYGSKKKGIPLSNKILMAASIVCVIATIVVFIFFNKFQKNRNQTSQTLNEPQATPQHQESQPTQEVQLDPIVPSGTTLLQRFNPQSDYTRVNADAGSFAEYLRNFALRAYAAKPLVYDSETSSLINNDSAPAVSVLAIDLINTGNLQISSNSIIRLYAEYNYSKENYSNIAFNLLTTPLFRCDFETWSNGGRLKVEGNQVSWCIDHNDSCGHRDVELGTSAGTFRYYLQNVMMHSNTSSLITNMDKISIDNAAIGDVIIFEDSPSDPVIIMDMAQSSDGSKIYIMARGGTPASEIYIVRNENDADLNPWHKLSDVPESAAVYRFK